jgi:geranyl-CoA carboxylase beta subunit
MTPHHGPVFRSGWDAGSPVALQRREAMLQQVARLRALEQRADAKSAEARPVFERRGQLLPRERIGLLLDAGRPFLPLCTLAGYLQDQKDPAASVPGGGIVAGIGFVSGVRCMVVASDSGIDAGAIQPMGLEKILRAQELALANRLPFLHLVESAGANLMRYRVETFVQGGALFRNLALLSAAGIPVVTVQHGSGTAGGAYMPGLSDIVIMVRGRSRAFLAGPPLLKAATGEVATEEELGGAEMHTRVSGLGEYLAEDDRHALGIAREVLARTGWQEPVGKLESDPNKEELLSLMPANLREPVDLREIMVRLVDEAGLLEFKPLHGAATVCAQGRVGGHAVGFVGNNGPIDVAGANKATHFIQWMCQLGHPIVYLQNTTGYIVGRQSEQEGMIKHGSKMIQAVANATVPQLTIQCGASYGAGNYGMCGRAYAPRFLFSWPGARTAVMGGEQAARTMQIVSEAAAARKGETPDPARLQAQYERIVDMLEGQADAFHTSGLLLDDGVIDPRDTRAVLAFCLDTVAAAQAKPLRPVQFGVARM